MPAIEQIRIQEPAVREDRIRELKARAAGALDDALGVVAKNLGREEARQAGTSLAGLSETLTAHEAPAHRLDVARVMDLISDRSGTTSRLLKNRDMLRWLRSSSPLVQEVRCGLELSLRALRLTVFEQPVF